MPKNLANDIDTKFIRQIQQQQIELSLLRAERDSAVRDRDLAQARSEGHTKLIDALLESLRPYGFSRKGFLSAIRRAAQTIPDHGVDSVQHTVLFDGSNRILQTRHGASIHPFKTRPHRSQVTS
ncbi:hypothetical protein CTI14_00990 [Methylobacterium radiotolerans]|uniref:hypothetical protein n=1 Tax=Methylobacterium sp. TaxID=409 RepID=UPI000CB4482D|nr:hypothetical protein [Methylobacterium sp.]PJI55910.1 hypothetical protein CTI14_00990 [Methylobacterium radiotolerans]RUP21850.1 MAG: hypothetical protein EKK44_07495 [Methylobacterium sp.]